MSDYKSYMLTGATGFIGSHILHHLTEMSCPVHLLVRRKNERLKSFEKKGVKIYQEKSVDDPGPLKASLQNMDVIIHCAAATKAVNRTEYIRANVTFTANILKCLSKDQKFIFISSQAAAGPSVGNTPLDETSRPRPINNYGKSKLMAEEAVQKWGEENNRNYTILRPSSVYGPREKDFYLYFKLINKGIFFLPNRGNQKISIIHVRDLVNAVWVASKHTFHGQKYFVTGDDAYSWKEIGRHIQKALGKHYVLKMPLPAVIAWPVAWLFDLIGSLRKKSGLISRQKLLEMKQAAWICTNKKIKSELSWEPRLSLEQGIKQTALWYQKENWI